MTDERQETRDLLERAAPELGTGMKARAMEAMAAAGSTDAPPRPRRWATAVGAALVLLAVGFVPYSAADSQAWMVDTLAAAQRRAASGEAPRRPSPGVMSDPQMDLAVYPPRVVEFVQRNYPGDPEMLMAAGLLAPEAEAGLELLRQALRLDPRPVVWAAYVQKLTTTGPKYLRPALVPGDPEEADFAVRVKQFREQPEFAKAPEALSEKAVAPILEGIQGWQKVEPRNAMPAALRCWYLYGLHRDAEAFRAWQEAGRLPVVEGHKGQILKAVVDLLSRMARPRRSSYYYLLTGNNPLPSFAPQLRDGARLALFEGRKAQMKGRPKDAIAWWKATIAVGRQMRESAMWTRDLQVAGAIEEVGASPTWRWAPGGSSYRQGSLPLRGRYLHGPQHAFYVSQVGEAADAAVRDSLILAKVRENLIAEAVQESRWQDSPYLRGLILLGLAFVTAELLAFLLLVYAGISVRHRRAADAASVLGGGARVWLAVIGLVPALAGDVALWHWMPNRNAGLPLIYGFVGGLVLSVLLTLLLPLGAAARRRAPEARVSTAWRGNLRKVLPISVVLLALAALTLAMIGRHERAQWIGDFSSGRYSQMTWAIGLAGRDKWNNPPIPKDAWRAEAPPSAEKSGAVSRP